MKTLYLLRHAKSSWAFDHLSDHDRPLNDRGRHDAPLMGHKLAEHSVLPDLIVTSPAVRTLTTATLVAKELGYDPVKIIPNDRLFHAGMRVLLQVIQETPGHVEKLMLVGHNYALTELANHLSPAPPVDNVPTAGVVALTFACSSWPEISRRNARLDFFDFPKNHLEGP